MIYKPKNNTKRDRKEVVILAFLVICRAFVEIFTLGKYTWSGYTDRLFGKNE